MIADSSVLIAFARLNRRDLLWRLFGAIEVPHSVYSEIVDAGGGRGDAAALKKAFGMGWLKAVELPQKAKTLSNSIQEVYPELAEAEADVVALACEYKKKVMIDEHAARVVARLQGVDCIGTLGILILACKKKVISEKDAKTLFLALVRENFRISPAIMTEFYDALERFRKR